MFIGWFGRVMLYVLRSYSANESLLLITLLSLLGVIFTVLLTLVLGSIFVLDILNTIGITNPISLSIVEIFIFLYVYHSAFRSPKEHMERIREITHIGAFALVFVGVTLIIMAFFTMTKFFVVSSLQPLVLWYLIGLHVILGIALVFSSIAYYEYGEHYMSPIGKIIAFAAVLAGLGYIFEGVGIIFWDILVLGIGITLTRIGLTFYVILSIWFYSEIEGGRLSTMGSALLVVFALPEFWFIFSTEFYRTVPGIIFMVFMGVMFMFQAYGLFRSTQREKKFVPKPEKKPQYIISPMGSME